MFLEWTNNPNILLALLPVALGVIIFCLLNKRGFNMAKKATTPANVITITSDYDSWKLNTSHDGKQKFWAEIMHELEKRDFGVLKVGVPMPEGVGAFFTDVSCVERICLPQSWTADPKTKTISFEDDTAFGIFVHEACHFLHFCRDEGRCDSPLFEGQIILPEDVYAKASMRRIAEFEAGYRSCFFNKIYKLVPGRKILDLNLQNMFIYDAKVQSVEWKKAYNEKIKDLKPAEFKKFQKNMFKKVNRFTEWMDPKHEIAGVL